MSITIALAGNPNCGKTTLFNALTGANQYVGNWPGVTVEKKEGKLKGSKDILIQDLPGIYSLSPYTLEEVVARGYLINQRPDAILNILDGTNIERNLYLTTQLLELGIPMVVAVNMMDLVQKNGDRIDLNALSRRLGVPVVQTSALKGEGAVEAARLAATQARQGKGPQVLPVFEGETAQAIEAIEKLAAASVPAASRRWFAVKLFERDEKVWQELGLSDQQKQQLEEIIAQCEDSLEDDAESIVTNRILALPIFVAVMAFVYYISIGTVGTYLTDWTNDVLFGEIIPPAVTAFLEGIGCAGWLVGLIVDGIVAGVGAVLGFVPQMLVLFLLLSILEDVGYMARIAFIMDRIFRKFGLSGKSFIPMLIGSGCGVPGVMASRTIENDRDRKITIMTTCFVPCGAKMPIVGLFAGALFGNSGWVATSAYFIGVAAIVISGIILKKFKSFAGQPAPFVMELPAYHMPAAGNVLRATWERGWSFIKRAGTVILASAIVLWFLQGFGFVDGSLVMVEDNNTSLLATIGSAIAFLFAPLGFGNWQAAVATFTGLIAKENVVNTFGVLYRFGGELSENGEEIWSNVAADYTALSAYSFMVFNLLCAPCFAAMGAIKREMNNGKWTLAAIGYMCLFAYGASLIIYQLGGLITGEVSVGLGTLAAAALVLAVIWLLVRPNKYSADYRRSAPAASGKKAAASI